MAIYDQREPRGVVHALAQQRTSDRTRLDALLRQLNKLHQSGTPRRFAPGSKPSDFPFDEVHALLTDTVEGSIISDVVRDERIEELRPTIVTSQTAKQYPGGANVCADDIAQFVTQTFDEMRATRGIKETVLAQLISQIDTRIEHGLPINREGFIYATNNAEAYGVEKVEAPSAPLLSSSLVRHGALGVRSLTLDGTDLDSLHDLQRELIHVFSGVFSSPGRNEIHTGLRRFNIPSSYSQERSWDRPLSYRNDTKDFSRGIFFHHLDDVITESLRRWLDSDQYGDFTTMTCSDFFKGPDDVGIDPQFVDAQQRLMRILGSIESHTLLSAYFSDYMRDRVHGSRPLADAYLSFLDALEHHIQGGITTAAEQYRLLYIIDTRGSTTDAKIARDLFDRSEREHGDEWRARLRDLDESETPYRIEHGHAGAGTQRTVADRYAHAVEGNRPPLSYAVHLGDGAVRVEDSHERNLGIARARELLSTQRGVE